MLEHNGTVKHKSICWHNKELLKEHNVTLPRSDLVGTLERLELA